MTKKTRKQCQIILAIKTKSVINCKEIAQRNKKNSQRWWMSEKEARKQCELFLPAMKTKEIDYSTQQI